MKILFIVGSLGWLRGTQRMFCECVRHFSENHDVIVWGYQSGGETEIFLKAHGYRVLIGNDRIDEAFSFYPDIVNIHHAGWHDATEIPIFERIKSTGIKCIETSVFGRVDPDVSDFITLSIQISRWDLFRWNRLKGVLSIPGVYCPYIVDTDSFRRVSDSAIGRFRDQFQVPRDAFVIGRAGKTNWERLEKPLLKALEDDKAVFFMSLADYNSPPPESILQHERVRIIPSRHNKEDLSTFYSACTIVISASPIGESFGMVIAEAMSCGTPVIAWSTPQCDNAQLEVVWHKVGGVVVADLKYLPHAIRKLKSDTAGYAKMAYNVRPLIEKRYSREVVTQQLDMLFEMVLQAGSRSDLFDRLRKNNVQTSVSAFGMWRSIFNVFGHYRVYGWLETALNLSPFCQRLNALRKRFF